MTDEEIQQIHDTASQNIQRANESQARRAEEVKNIEEGAPKTMDELREARLQRQKDELEIQNEAKKELMAYQAEIDNSACKTELESCRASVINQDLKLMECNDFNEELATTNLETVQGWMADTSKLKETNGYLLTATFALALLLVISNIVWWQKSAKMKRTAHSVCDVNSNRETDLPKSSKAARKRKNDTE